MKCLRSLPKLRFSFLIALTMATLFIQAQAQVPVSTDAIDAQRSERFSLRLTKLQGARVAMSSRSSALLAQTPELQQELQRWLSSSLVSAEVLSTTPPVLTVPTLLQTFRTYRGQSGDVILRPELLLWYTFQDNTFARQQMLRALSTAQANASQSYAVLQSSRAAIEQVAAQADQNFLDFRHLSDVMGRRSPLELAEAERLAGEWIAGDPLHPGAALVQAHALRSMGRFDECTRLLDRLDDNFPAMQSINAAVSGQIAYIGGDRDQAKRLCDRGIALARDSGASEATLLAGWLLLADRKFSPAKAQASRLRALAPDDVETSILEALAVAYERPSRARDALQTLRSAQLNTSPDDWHYHEALAIVHAIARDHQFAERKIAEALSTAPSHVRAELEREQKEILQGLVPDIDWHARLHMQWHPTL